MPHRQLAAGMFVQGSDKYHEAFDQGINVPSRGNLAIARLER